ncbi:hypothetical protein PR048_031548 [Dryococelus australis]|uniref:Uncharacterized protein n=1 Tax=Dryococelus australis TaxID=614101 RepID=A0ABQ9G5L1_9NEOP|nr:hypothetical protein PR048_031548 [Dryococelus australis]
MVKLQSEKKVEDGGPLDWRRESCRKIAQGAKGKRENPGENPTSPSTIRRCRNPGVNPPGDRTQRSSWGWVIREMLQTLTEADKGTRETPMLPGSGKGEGVLNFTPYRRARSPPTKANQVQSPSRATPGFSHAGIMSGRANGRSQGKTRRPTASSGTISTCENAVTRLGIEPGSPWWEASVADRAATVAPTLYDEVARTGHREAWKIFISKPGGQTVENPVSVLATGWTVRGSRVDALFITWERLCCSKASVLLNQCLGYSRADLRTNLAPPSQVKEREREAERLAKHQPQVAGRRVCRHSLSPAVPSSSNCFLSRGEVARHWLSSQDLTAGIPARAPGLVEACTTTKHGCGYRVISALPPVYRGGHAHTTYSIWETATNHPDVLSEKCGVPPTSTIADIQRAVMSTP